MKYYTTEDGWHHPVRQTQSGEPRKLILRAPGSLQLSQITPLALHRMLVLTSNLTAEEAAGMTTTVEPFKNIVVMTSNNISTINKLLMITQITHDQTTHSVSVYAPAARETCKGVIHQVERNTDPATLMQLLTAPPGFNIVAARMMGGSTTAIITFEGTYIPLSVSLGGAIHRCKPHRPKAQICFKCLGLGHRADVCTRATTARCPNCGYANKDEAHTCITKCVNCQGPHRSDDASCSKKLEADAVVRQQAYLKRLNIRKHAAESSSRSQQQLSEKPQQPAQSQTAKQQASPQQSHQGQPAPGERQPSKDPNPNRQQQLDKGPYRHKQQQPKKVSQPLSYKQANRTYREALTPHLTIPKAPIYNAQVYQQHIGTAPPPPPNVQLADNVSMETSNQENDSSEPENKRSKTNETTTSVTLEELNCTLQSFMTEIRYEMQCVNQRVTEITHTIEARVTEKFSTECHPLQEQIQAVRRQLDMIMQKLYGQ